MKLSSSFVALATALFAAPQLVQANCAKYTDAARTAAANLQARYFVSGGYPRDLQWVWISAVDAFYLRELDAVTGENAYQGVIDTVFNGWEDWLNNGQSYDDVQWVAIAYLQAGRVDLAKHYYNIASSASETSYCGGGLFWSGARDYKNAITNELYITSSGFLFDVTLDRVYLDNAINTWNWLKNTPMRGPNGLFNDGLNKECQNNGQAQWTYNQGALLPGLAYIWKHTQDEAAIQYAWSIIDSVIASGDISPNGGLREPCETTGDNRCNADQNTFKGILTSYIAWFLRVSGRDQDGKYSNFVKQQGDRILQFAVGPEGWYSNLWYGPNENNSAKWTAPSQGSALGGLIGAAQQNC